MAMNRLSHAPDRSGSFWFEGRQVPFHEGDTLAAALHAQAIRTLARSRKFHRPRGLSGTFVAGHLCGVEGSPHVRLDRTAATQGVRVAMENTWPGGTLDALRLARLIPRRWLRAGFEHSRLVSSGTALFEPWERFMRFMAGEAPVHGGSGRAIPEGRRLTPDLVVVGGGPAGREAANTAAAEGRSVVLVTRGHIAGARAATWGVALPPLDASVTVLTEHEACGLYDRGRHLLCVPHDAARGATIVAAGEVILATGRRSVPPLVAGADLPGVMDEATALALAHRHAVAPGAQVAVVGSGMQGALAARLEALGVTVAASLPATRLERIVGWSAVSGIDAGGHIVCDAVVHAGPWRSDRRLAFMAGADGELRVLAGALPNAVRVVGSAALDDEAVCHGAGLDRRALACPCMDVTVDELLDLIAAGETHVEVLKRLTGCGMGPCQGIPCWDNLAHIVAHATGRNPEEIGHPTYRPPGAGLTLAQAAGLQGLVPLS